MALIDVDYFMKMPLGLKGPRAYPEADILSTYIDTASEQVEKLCDRQFALQSQTETLRGKDTYRLILGEFPVANIDSITWEDDSTGTTGTIDVTLVRALEWGAVEFKRQGSSRNQPSVYAGPQWFDRGRLYSVTYTAGYDPIPGPVKHATALAVAQLLQPNYGGAMDSVPELVPQTTQMMVDLLDDYRRRTKRA